MLVFDASFVRQKINKALRLRLQRAAIRLGLVHACSLGHDWHMVGGRACPRRWDALDGGGRCSQTVYKCRRCDAYDYGEPGGPAYRECFTEGPCDPSCVDGDTAKDGAGIPTSGPAVLEP